MPRLVLAVFVASALLVGCGPKDGPKLPTGGAPSAAQSPASGAGQPVGGAHAHPVAAGEGDACCPSDGQAVPSAIPVTGNEEGHPCNCSELKPGCKCGHCSGAIPVCHCKHEKKPGQ